ncbi:MAG: proton-conducting transporter membrane subunit [Candidatus Sumerlaeota bacterium]|nr:proton-conducting transporter membrane subunit [Candidatus Sumerlaeota bacterium]
MILIPAVAGALAFLIRNDGWRRALLVLAAAAHLAVVAAQWPGVLRNAATPAFLAALASPDVGWLGLDAPGLLFLSIASALFLAAAIYAVGYLRAERKEPHKDPEEGEWFNNAPETVFTGCLLLFLSTMTLVTLSRHFGLLWVGIEATTLASAPLIYFHRHHRSLEATWKYLMICSVGIALALLGTFFLAAAASKPGALGAAGGAGAHNLSLALADLVAGARSLDPLWLKAAFILLLVGYGAKMGLAPLHTWLPDAHSESPSVVSALLSGALLNCAFLGILRIQQVLSAAGMAAFGQELLVLFGLISMGFAAIFIIGQTDYKRMLAYSSVEHVGILALGVGIGGAGIFGSMLHAVNHSLTKGMLFLVAGNLLAAYKTKEARGVRGLKRTLPISGALWMAGFLAICGTPPFGPFLSEFTIFKAALDQGHNTAAIFYLVFLSLIFIGMATMVLPMVQGRRDCGLGIADCGLGNGNSQAPDGSVQGSAGQSAIRNPQSAIHNPQSAIGNPQSAIRESFLSVFSPLVLCALILMLGLYIPQPLQRLIQAAVEVLGAK